MQLESQLSDKSESVAAQGCYLLLTQASCIILRLPPGRAQTAYLIAIAPSVRAIDCCRRESLNRLRISCLVPLLVLLERRRDHTLLADRDQPGPRCSPPSPVRSLRPVEKKQQIRLLARPRCSDPGSRHCDWRHWPRSPDGPEHSISAWIGSMFQPARSWWEDQGEKLTSWPSRYNQCYLMSSSCTAVHFLTHHIELFSIGKRDKPSRLVVA